MEKGIKSAQIADIIREEYSVDPKAHVYVEETGVEFVSYDGRYPCRCYGTLVLRIDGEEVVLKNALRSGGSVWFDDDWNEHVEQGEWGVEIPEEYQKYSDEIHRVVNDNVPDGCCGGCV